MTRPSFLLIGLLLLTLCACKREKSDEPVVAQNLLNESYGSNAKQKFDIYLPANRNEEMTPVLFLIHGGGWSSGDKSDFTDNIQDLKNTFPGYAFVSIGYRLYAGGASRFPVQEQDVKACIEYVLDNYKKYKISQKFAIWGASAGAHLSLLYAYKYGPDSYMPSAVIEYAGPTELISMYHDVNNPIIQALLHSVVGNINTADSLIYKSSSPVNFITTNSPPTLILHGDADDIVPYQQAVLLHQKLTEHQVQHVYKLYPGEGHGFSALASFDAAIHIKLFLEEYLN